jgi:predicted alpha/beta superfamily hydrolase
MSDETKRQIKNAQHVFTSLLLSLLFPLLETSCNPIQKRTIESRILKEKRNLFIRLPEGYKNSVAEYPVLFILDGHRLTKKPFEKTFDRLAQNDEVPDVIMVGIANKVGITRTSRNRDFSPNGEGAQNFLKFIKQEVIPSVDKNFRTNGSRILLGHSSAGLFTIFALFSDPGLFRGYVSSCPALSAEDKMMLDMARAFVKTSKSTDNFLFIGIGEEDYSGFISSTEKVVAMLKSQAPGGLILEYHKYPGENHYSTPFRTFHEGIIAIFRAFPE